MTDIKENSSGQGESREYKFRAWDGEKMSRIFTMQDIGYEGFPSMCYNFPEERDYIKESIVIMQYTGLKDKNGKEIYDGDIVLFLGLKFLVAIDQYGLNFQSIPGYEENRFGKGRLEYIYQDCEIIGNIHETPELLS